MPLQDTDPTPSFGGFGLRQYIWDNRGHSTGDDAWQSAIVFIDEQGTGTPGIKCYSAEDGQVAKFALGPLPPISTLGTLCLCFR